MANLLIMQLSAVSKIFSRTGTKYALFTVQDQDTKKVFEAGLTHNSLKDKGFNLNFLDSLNGCTITTKSFVDRDGVIQDPQDQIDRCNDGQCSLVLLNSQNSNVIKSELYIAETKDMAASVEAKVITEQNREETLEKTRQQALRLMQRAMKATVSTETPTVTEEPKTLDMQDEVFGEEVSEEIPF